MVHLATYEVQRARCVLKPAASCRVHVINDAVISCAERSIRLKRNKQERRCTQRTTVSESVAMLGVKIISRDDAERDLREEERKAKKDKKKKDKKEDKRKRKESGRDAAAGGGGSSDSDGGGDAPAAARSDQPTSGRDDWMSEMGVLEAGAAGKTRGETKKPNKREVAAEDSAKIAAERELNPFWKDGGDGKPKVCEVENALIP